MIQWILTSTTGSSTCAQMLMHAIANRGVWTHVRVCAERRLREKNPLLHQGPWASLSSVPVRCVTHWATSPPLIMCPVTNTAVHAQSFHTVVKSLISTGPAVHRMADPRTACNGLKSSFQSWHANRLKTSPASYKTSLTISCRCSNFGCERFSSLKDIRCKKNQW